MLSYVRTGGRRGFGFTVLYMMLAYIRDTLIAGFRERGQQRQNDILLPESNPSVLNSRFFHNIALMLITTSICLLLITLNLKVGTLSFSVCLYVTQRCWRVVWVLEAVVYLTLEQARLVIA